MPDFKRKLNTVPIPRLGGVGFFFAFFMTLGMKSLVFSSATTLDSVLLISGGLILLLGAADDLFDIPAIIKLSLQSVIALFGTILLLSGESVLTIASATFYVILLTNAYNLIDGLDGLCAGLAVSALFFYFICDLCFLNMGSGFIAILLLFSVVGFLPHNVYPAKMYMGDSGSEALGLSIALIGISQSQEGIFLSPAFCLIPIFDTFFAFLRRILRGRSPFSADNRHIHHKLLSLGLSPLSAVNILVTLSVLFSLIALLVAIRLSL